MWCKLCEFKFFVLSLDWIIFSPKFYTFTSMCLETKSAAAVIGHYIHFINIKLDFLFSQTEDLNLDFYLTLMA